MGLPFLDSGREKYITTRPRDSQKFKPKLNPATVNLELTKYPKSTTNQLVYQQHFAELKTQYPENVSIYTDGSKYGVGVTAAAIVNNQAHICRLPDHSSIFSAEAKVIQIALEAIKG
jgi:hypothetical protein